MRASPSVLGGPAPLGQALATLIADGIAAAPPGSRYLLGCPSGRSPVSTETVDRIAATAAQETQL